MDDIELGKHAASAMHLENNWVEHGAASMIEYYEMNRIIDEYRASPEGAEAEAAAIEALRKRQQSG